MAGQPKRRAMVEELERMTRDYFDGDPVPTHLQYVCCELENGKTIADIARIIASNIDLDISREMLTTYVHSLENAAEMLATSRRRASHSWGDKAVEAVDAQVDDSVGVARANNKSRVYLRMAEAYESGSYGQSKGVNVSISLGGLHLTALQAVNREVTGGVQVASLPSPDTRVIPSQT